MFYILQKVITLVSILFILMSQPIFAHSYLEDSKPKDGELVTEPLQQITLLFNTKIEQTSTIEVLNSNGEQINLGNFVIEEGEIWATFLNPLEKDTYKVIWNIVGADGHPINGEFSFSVDVTNEEQDQKKKEESDSQTEQEEVASEEVKEGTIQDEQKLPSFLIPVLIVVLATVGLGLLWWVVRRK
ncbi:copper resistance protein CopC [Cytobacillus suaedae]|nr:copper resistance protein CopC [Cytobacillus suaedae]